MLQLPFSAGMLRRSIQIEETSPLKKHLKDIMEISSSVDQTDSMEPNKIILESIEQQKQSQLISNLQLSPDLKATDSSNQNRKSMIMDFSSLMSNSVTSQAIIPQNNAGDTKITYDTKTLIEILKKEQRKLREIGFIEKAVAHLKFFRDRKQQLSTKLFTKLLEKLKYVHLSKQTPLFHHGDKGDKYYIVLRGSLVLLSPLKPFEIEAKLQENADIFSHAFIARLKDRYHKKKEAAALHGDIAECPDGSFAIVAASLGGKFDMTAAGSRSHSVLKKLSWVNRGRPDSPSSMLNKHQSQQQLSLKLIGSPKANLNNQNHNHYSQGTMPSLSHDAEFDQLFDLYCDAYFPKFKQEYRFEEGTGFGEIALLRKTDRSGTVVSREDCDLMCLEKNDYVEILGQWERQKSEEALNFLKSFAFFKDVPDKPLMGLLYTTRTSVLQLNNIVYRPGDCADQMYLIRSGEIEICVPQQQNQLQNGSAPILENGSQQVQSFSLSPSKKVERISSSVSIGSNIESSTQLPKENKQQSIIPNQNWNRLEFVRFSLLSSNGFFGDEDLILDIQNRSHMARVASTTSELWIIEKSAFITVLKNQRSHAQFLKVSLSSIQMKEKRLEKIEKTIAKTTNLMSATIKPIDFSKGKMKSNIHSFGRNANINLGKNLSMDEQRLTSLLNYNCVKKQIHGSSAGGSDVDIGLIPKVSQDSLEGLMEEAEFEKQVAKNKRHAEFLNPYLNANKSDEVFKQSVTSDENLKDQARRFKDDPAIALSIFSRCTQLQTLKKENRKKQRILKKFYEQNNNRTNQQHARSNSHEGFSNSASAGNAQRNNHQVEDSTSHLLLPYQQNLIFQPQASSGIRKEAFRDPFKPLSEDPHQRRRALKNKEKMIKLMQQQSQETPSMKTLTTDTSEQIHHHQMHPKRFGSMTSIAIASPRSSAILRETVDIFKGRRSSIEETQALTGHQYQETCLSMYAQTPQQKQQQQQQQLKNPTNSIGVGTTELTMNEHQKWKSYGDGSSGLLGSNILLPQNPSSHLITPKNQKSRGTGSEERIGGYQLKQKYVSIGQTDFSKAISGNHLAHGNDFSKSFESETLHSNSSIEFASQMMRPLIKPLLKGWNQNLHHSQRVINMCGTPNYKSSGDMRRDSSEKSLKNNLSVGKQAKGEKAFRDGYQERVLKTEGNLEINFGVKTLGSGTPIRFQGTNATATPILSNVSEQIPLKGGVISKSDSKGWGMMYRKMGGRAPFPQNY